MIIGDAGSVFIKQYIEYVLLDLHCEIVLIQEGFICEDYLKFYKENGIQIESFSSKTIGIFAKIPKIRSSLGCYLWSRYIVKKYGHFDLVHIHGICISRANIGKYLRKHAEKLVITVWGDELFRRSAKQLEQNKIYYDIADIITVSTGDMYNRFLEVYGSEYAEHVVKNKFAVGILDKIDIAKKQYSNCELRESFGINNQDKKLIFIGHNGREAQRHFELTEAVSKLPEDLKKNIYLVYTMTYGVKNEKYLSELEELAKATGCEYIILTEFLNEERTAKLRAICDIMLHAQLTDAFSASICECLYAGAIVINGSWLAYNDLPDCHSRFVEYKDMQELPDRLISVLNDYELYRRRMDSNHQAVYNLCSKASTTELWRTNLQLK